MGCSGRAYGRGMIEARSWVEARLAGKLFAVHDALESAGIPHAVGGAIDLVFCAEHPRETSDLDMNVFLGVDQGERVLAALPGQVERSEVDLETIVERGQVRLWWGGTSVDLFFNNLPVHEEIARARQTALLEQREIPIVDPASLVTFKAMFDRPNDWRDIENIMALDRAPVAFAARRVAALMGEDDPITARLNSLLDPGRER